jgi:hypothetical protein
MSDPCWQDALDTQIHLLDLCRHGRLRWAAKDGLGDAVGLGEHDAGTVLSEALRASEPVYVSPDVCAAWEFAQAAFEPEPLHPSDPFAAAGLALFPKPVALLNDVFPIFPPRAVSWSSLELHDPNEWRIMLAGFSRADDADLTRVDDAAELGELARRREWMLTSVVLLPFGPLPEGTDAKGKRAWRMMQAFWRMAREFVREPERAPRGFRRAAKRAGLEREHVTVMRLRRVKATEPATERAVDWTCQWVVRGHWRNQWYPSARQHRQRYVPAYVKGPPDKPLRVTERVVEFVR